ncbi:hydrogenase maturation protease [Candidatus Leptofilum sp.]|uniref:hydrogenase maturation protease n=1 Tax=Candidatus Leptofilum sp. TaxID=3241576 RepID=UPI003B5B127E
MRVADTLILGLGNPLRGDDGVGTAVIAALQNNHLLPPGVDLLDGGTAGLELVLLLQKYRRVFVVDAAEMGLAAGARRQIDVRTAVLPTPSANPPISLHRAGFSEALALAEALDVLPAEIILFGIQPAQLNWSEGLSVAVQTAVAPVCQALLSALD